MTFPRRGMMPIVKTSLVDAIRSFVSDLTAKFIDFDQIERRGKTGKTESSRSRGFECRSGDLLEIPGTAIGSERDSDTPTLSASNSIIDSSALP
jgi:hypothetical protein